MEDVLKIAGGVVFGLFIWSLIDLFAFAALEAKFGPGAPPPGSPGGPF